MPKPKVKRVYRKRFCGFCSDRIKYVDYKNISLLRRFISDKGKMKARRATGVCAKHQRNLATAIKRARFIGLIPYKREKYR